MVQPIKHGKIAFITTPNVRKYRQEMVELFVYRYMYGLCHSFTVMTTGRTYDFLSEILNRPLLKIRSKTIEAIEEDTRLSIESDSDLKRWRETIQRGLRRTMIGYPGMIHIAYELVEGRLDAVIHLTDWEDKSGKPDSAVLSREANVHDVPTATDVETAIAQVRSWQSILAKKDKTGRLFKERNRTNNPLRGLNKKNRVLAMVAHDNMKLELCCFAVKHATHIFRNYDYILATGTTGTWLKRFMDAAGRSDREIGQIRCCLSGPKGGDIQIAYGVVKGLCREIIFFQDPSVSHAHDSDIRLFEQAVLHKNVKVSLATNVESARFVLGV